MNATPPTLASTLTNKLWKRVVIFLVLLVITSGFVDSALLHAQNLTAIPTKENNLQGSISIFCLVGVFTLWRTFLYDRSAFTAGIAAGAAWLVLTSGDALATPFWAGSMALVIYLIRALPALGKIHVWYLILGVLAIVGYREAYGSLIAHPYYLTALGVVAIITVRRRVKMFRKLGSRPQTKAASAPAPKTPVQTAVSQPEPKAPPAPFDDDIARLEAFQNLPVDINNALAGIIKYARLIQECMLNDPRDVEPGTKFLQRYLPVVREIMEKGQTLSKQLEKHGSESTLHARKVETLNALHQAFRQKHAQLLENDETELNTDMSTAEKMLKTDGFL